MLLWLHAVVQHSANPNEIRADGPIQKQVPRTPYKPFNSAGMIATVAKVVCSNAGAEFRSGCGPNRVKIGGDISKSTRKQYFIAASGCIAKRFFCACKKIDNICLGEVR
jgi:hypothetical protein